VLNGKKAPIDINLCGTLAAEVADGADGGAGALSNYNTDPTKLLSFFYFIFFSIDRFND
jgi:hypothetical protein